MEDNLVTEKDLKQHDTTYVIEKNKPTQKRLTTAILKHTINPLLWAWSWPHPTHNQ